MGFFLLGHSNWMKFNSSKISKKFQFILDSKRSEGLMSLVSFTMSVEKFSKCLILLLILLMILRA